MKIKYNLTYLIIFLMSLLILGCSDSETSPNPKRMLIFSSITNYKSSNSDSTLSFASIRVNYFPAVKQTSFIIDGENVLEDSGNFIPNKYWESSDNNSNYFLTNQDAYNLKITANDGDCQATATCQIPSEFSIEETNLPAEVDTLNGFTINWTNSENAEYYSLYYTIYNEDSSADSLIVFDSNTNSFTFTPDMFILNNPTRILFHLSSYNNLNFYDSSTNDISGDGRGYFFGKYQSENIILFFENAKQNSSLKDKSFNMKRVKKENLLLQRYLGILE